MNTQKGFAPILIILILAAAFLSGYFVYTNYSNNQTKLATSPTVQPTTQSSPSPTATSPAPTGNGETAHWKTYIFSVANPDSYSLKYPPDWEENDQGNPNLIQLTNYDPNKAPQRGFDPTTDKGLLKIEIYNENTKKDLKSYITDEKIESIELHGKETESLWSETEMKVDNQYAIKVKDINPGFVIYVQHPSKTSILSIAFELDFDNYQDLADQILSTFKFTQ